MSKPDIEIVTVDKFQLLQHTLKELGIKCMVETAPIGRVALSIWDDAENEVIFIFSKNGDVVDNLVYWEVWKA